MEKFLGDNYSRVCLQLAAGVRIASIQKINEFEISNF